MPWAGCPARIASVSRDSSTLDRRRRCVERAEGRRPLARPSSGPPPRTSGRAAPPRPRCRRRSLASASTRNAGVEMLVSRLRARISSSGFCGLAGSIAVAVHSSTDRARYCHRWRMSQRAIGWTQVALALSADMPKRCSSSRDRDKLEAELAAARAGSPSSRPSSAAYRVARPDLARPADPARLPQPARARRPARRSATAARSRSRWSTSTASAVQPRARLREPATACWSRSAR